MYTGKVQKSGKGRKSAIRHLKPAHSAQAVKVLFCLVDSAVSLGSGLCTFPICVPITLHWCGDSNAFPENPLKYI